MAVRATFPRLVVDRSIHAALDTDDNIAFLRDILMDKDGFFISERPGADQDATARRTRTTTAPTSRTLTSEIATAMGSAISATTAAS